MTTTAVEKKDLLHQFQEQVWKEGNLDRIDEFFADNFVGHSAGAPEEIHGPAEYKDFVATTLEASSDMSVTVEDRIAEGDKVAQRVVVTGTHDGEFMGIPPTGKKFELPGIDIYRVEDGKFVEGWEQANMMGLMQQFGVIEPLGE